jgi:hypothetical protein
LINFIGKACPSVGRGVGFLNVLVIRLRSLLLAASLSFESEWHKQIDTLKITHSETDNDANKDSALI